MSNKLFLGVCTFMSLLVHLRNAKRTFTSTFWLMCTIWQIVSWVFVCVTHVLFGLAGFTEEDARQICLTGHKHEEHEEKLHFFLGISFFVGLFGLDSTSFKGFCVFFFSLHAPTRSHKYTCFSLVRRYL